MGHSCDMLTFDFLLKPPQPFTGLFFEPRFGYFLVILNSDFLILIFMFSFR